MPGIAEFVAVTLDCPEPPVLAAFYAAVTGGEVTYDTPEASAVKLPGGMDVYFQGVAGHRPPTWPEGDRPQQFHLDFYVDDLDKAEETVTGLGGARPGFQPGGDRWRVLTDPAGHPFCVCLRQN
ncbi:VOC family protein [Actinomadura luteofluorescens]|uniref:Putative enzyme related to lactoylglutathione lyase n=1 Tax=Actinomadura luteofluorescens TaxID=46163 RepID=A0A7Y9ES37_9ACTN|nr:VOC family protein [Actinomadura luteofluorescens]NYD52919.1 putative enzyme related to lactoylglutathione lyase [Actinomadura luteofluorescens]